MRRGCTTSTPLQWCLAKQDNIDQRKYCWITISLIQMTVIHLRMKVSLSITDHSTTGVHTATVDNARTRREHEMAELVEEAEALIEAAIIIAMAIEKSLYQMVAMSLVNVLS